jgi:hypothetical protein
MEGQGGGEAQGVTDPKNQKTRGLAVVLPIGPRQLALS